MKDNFEKAAAASNLPVVRLKDWIFVPSKTRNNLRSRIRSQVADHIMQNLDILSLLPFSMDELINHLDSLGFDWENLGTHHIDHKKPKSMFKFKSFGDKSFQDCWSLKNLQPLPAKENLKKQAKDIYGENG
jgi:hypothetical protein